MSVCCRATQFQSVLADRFANVGLGGNMGALYKESQHCFRLFASGGALRCKGFLATLEVSVCVLVRVFRPPPPRLSSSD